MLGSDAAFSVDMFPPYAFVDSVRSLALELSTQDGRLLYVAPVSIDATARPAAGA